MKRRKSTNKICKSKYKRKFKRSTESYHICSCWGRAAYNPSFLSLSRVASGDGKDSPHGGDTLYHSKGKALLRVSVQVVKCVWKCMRCISLRTHWKVGWKECQTEAWSIIPASNLALLTLSHMERYKCPCYEVPIRDERELLTGVEICQVSLAQSQMFGVSIELLHQWRTQIFLTQHNSC